MAGVFIAQKPLKVAVEDVYEDVPVDITDGKGGTTTVVQSVKIGVNETWRQPGEIVPEVDAWNPAAIDTALSRGEISYTDQETLELRQRVEALEETVAQLTNRTASTQTPKKGS